MNGNDMLYLILSTIILGYLVYLTILTKDASLMCDRIIKKSKDIKVQLKVVLKELKGKK